MGKVLLILGALFFILSLGVLFVSLLLPVVNGPRTSWAEAAWGIIPGALCSLFSFVILLVGLVLLLTAGPRGKGAGREE